MVERRLSTPHVGGSIPSAPDSGNQQRLILSCLSRFSRTTTFCSLVLNV